MDIPGMFESARPILIAFGLKVIGAIAAYIIGRMLIGLRFQTGDEDDGAAKMSSRR